MPAAHPDLIAWIDTETTGLDPEHDYLLELAIIITDNALNEVGDFSVVIQPLGGACNAVGRMGEFVRDMHTTNGLIDALGSPDAYPSPAADSLAAGAIDHISGSSTPLLLGGNSITHDRNFLRSHAPQTFSRLHYRSIDVSGIELDLARDGYAGEIASWRESFTPSDAHRALGDIRDSIRQLAAMRAIRCGVSLDA